MAVRLLAVPVTVLAVMVSRLRVFLGLVVLAVGVMVGRLKVMMRSGVMMRGRLVVMLDGRVCGLLWHGVFLVGWFDEPRCGAAVARVHSGRSETIEVIRFHELSRSKSQPLLRQRRTDDV
jgi:hypothetical protein